MSGSKSIGEDIVWKQLNKILGLGCCIRYKNDIFTEKFSSSVIYSIMICMPTEQKFISSQVTPPSLEYLINSKLSMFILLDNFWVVTTMPLTRIDTSFFCLISIIHNDSDNIFHIQYIPHTFTCA